MLASEYLVARRTSDCSDQLMHEGLELLTEFPAQHWQNYYLSMSNPAQNSIIARVIIKLRYLAHLLDSKCGRLRKLEEN